MNNRFIFRYLFLKLRFIAAIKPDFRLIFIEDKCFDKCLSLNYEAEKEKLLDVIHICHQNLNHIK